MCRRVECDQCKRPTYAGCGAHVEAVLRDVPVDKRCRCRADQPSETKRWRWPWQRG